MSAAKDTNRLKGPHMGFRQLSDRGPRSSSLARLRGIHLAALKRNAVGLCIVQLLCAALVAFLLQNDWGVDSAATWFYCYAVILSLTTAYSSRRRANPLYASGDGPAGRFSLFVGVLVYSSIGSLATRAALVNFQRYDEHLAICAAAAMTVVGAIHVSTMPIARRRLLALMVIPYAVLYGLEENLQSLAFLTLLLAISAFAAGRRLHAEASGGFMIATRRVERARALREKNYELEKALALKTGLIASVGHDLRQPAHTIGLISANLALLQLSPRDNEDLEGLLEASAALSDLLSQIMELTQVEIGTYAARIGPVQLAPILRRALAIYGRPARAKKLNLTLECTASWVRTDADLLQRIIFNLLANAIRYTDTGGVEIGCSEDTQGSVVWIKDTGRGIDASRLPRIFEDYFQIDPSTRVGLGLGLAFVRRAVDLLDHRISVESSPGEGSKFTLHLPRSEVRLDRSTLSTVETPSGELVAVIENAPLARRAICDLLCLWGYAAVGASETSALDFGSHRPSDLRLIISDLHLDSQENGFAAIDSLRALADNPTLPAILTTGDMESAVRDQAQRKSIRLLFKPVPPRNLHLEITALLNADAAATV